MRVLITGHKGQLGKALQTRLESLNAEFSGRDLPEWDMLDPVQVRQVLQDFKPDVVIHTAALTAVDYCAEHPEEAVKINGVGTYNIAIACQEAHALLVAVSTNEVFDGTAKRPYQEYDQRNPINPYGYSKYVAEQVVERYCSRYMIVRTAWLYAPGGKNFIHKIIDRAQSGQPVRVVTDEVGSPTRVDDLAEALITLAQTDRPGLYHMVNSGECSRYEFASEILRLAQIDTPIEPITLADFSRPSSPPPYAPLANVFGAATGVTLRGWQAALADYMQAQRESMHG